LHRRFTDPQFLGQFSARPMRASIRRFPLSAANDAGLYRTSDGTRLTSLVPPLQSIHPTLLEVALPLRYRRRAGTQPPLNLPITEPFG
ncbi:MAG: hypothetical protein M3Y72_01805, partial [Acidobacteriota bacterium]|nr:hypothetical protein [Acidobacteriota bacterium]